MHTFYIIIDDRGHYRKGIAIYSTTEVNKKCVFEYCKKDENKTNLKNDNILSQKISLFAFSVLTTIGISLQCKKLYSSIKYYINFNLHYSSFT
jgi:hypothetical protein